MLLYFFNEHKTNGLFKGSSFYNLDSRIYLFIIHITHPTAAGSTRNNAKKMRQGGKNEEKQIGAEGETIHPNPDN